MIKLQAQRLRRSTWFTSSKAVDQVPKALTPYAKASHRAEGEDLQPSLSCSNMTAATGQVARGRETKIIGDFTFGPTISG